MQIPSWIKPGLWGVALGAVVWWGVLAWGLGWISPAAARQQADNQTQAAVVAVAAPDCITRFEHQADAVSSWHALQKSANNYNQDEYIEKGGWAAVPDQKSDSDIVDAVADACATQLLKLKQLNGVTLTSAKASAD